MLWPQQVASFQEKGLLAKRTSDKKRHMYYEKVRDIDKTRKRACGNLQVKKKGEV